MTYPQWPEWGSHKPDPPPWHYWTSPEGAHHAGPALDTVIAPWPGATGELREYTVIRCESCILVHVTPLPTPEALRTYYETQFYQETKPDYVDRYERDREWWEMTHTAILQRAAQYGRQSENALFLEIGCGPGIALDAAQNMGMETWGIEPNRRCVERLASRHKIVHGTLETTQQQSWLWRQESFDYIYLYEVLEHQANPEDHLLRCHEMLKPGGVLVVEVPNDYSWIQLQACEELGLPHWWLSMPDHLSYFSPKTLQLLLRRCGYDITYNRSTFALESFLLDGTNYIGNDTLGRQCHEQRMRIELEAWHTHRWQFVEDTYQANLAQGIGRELVYIARRRD